MLSGMKSIGLGASYRFQFVLLLGDRNYPRLFLIETVKPVRLRVEIVNKKEPSISMNDSFFYAV